MHKNKIIIFSALIIAVFGLLFYLENPEKAPRSEVKDFFRKYEGTKGFAIIKMPSFLMGNVLPDSSASGIKKENFNSFRVMIFHQRESEHISCAETQLAVVEFLDSLKFNKINEKHENNRLMQVYQKPRKGQWNEHVTMYSSDSTLFMFNFINNLKKRQVIEFSSQLDYQDFI